MKAYQKPEKEITEIVKKYKRGREFPQISLEVEYNGKKYRELKYSAVSLLGKSKNVLTGLVFLDEKGGILTDKKLQRELTAIFFNYEQLFDEEFITKLGRTIVTDKNIEMEEKKVEYLEAIFSILISKEVYGAEKVKDIVAKMPQIKRENNKLIDEFIDIVKKSKESQLIKSNTIMFEIKQLYTATLMKNFEKIKLIASGGNYYSDVKKEASKLFKKKLIGLMGSNTEGGTAKLDYELNHFIQVINVYEQIVNMSKAEYVVYLNNMEKEHIEDMISKNRA